MAAGLHPPFLRLLIIVSLPYKIRQMRIALIRPNSSFPMVRPFIPALKRINIFRLLTIVMLTVYSIGIIMLIYSFPIPAFISLGAGMLAVLCIAFLFRQHPIKSRFMPGKPIH